MHANFDSNEIRKILQGYIDEMYPMEKGEPIYNMEQSFRIHDGRLSRRHIKHIVEQRKSEGKSTAEIKEMFDYIPSVVADFDFEIPNHNKKYPESILRFKVFQEFERGVVVVMDKKECNKRDIITVYFCSPKKIYLKKKKLNATAAGETPHS